MQKIAVFGLAGTGKTTLAGQIADRLGVEHHDLDMILFTSTGALPLDEFRDRVDDITTGDAWAIDGNYSKLADVTWDRGDLVIWLDCPLPLWRQVRRGVRRRTGREHDPQLGHPAKRRSLLLTTIRKYYRNRARYAARLAQSEDTGTRVTRVRSGRCIQLNKIAEH